MKSRRILAVLAACTAVTFTGCGVVTVVPIGEEASYTGKQEFDPQQSPRVTGEPL
ncbi:MAG: hypothetical protein ACLRMZ_23010 [Blautia marasmi]